MRTTVVMLRRALRGSVRSALFALPLLAALAAPADAQRSGRDPRRDPPRRGDWPPQHRRERPMFALDAGGLFTSLRGDALGNVGDGTGLDIMGSIGSGVFSLGAGYQRSWHSQPNNGDDVVVDGGFIEPRIALPFATGNFTPYVLGRAARLTRRPPNAGVGSSDPTVKGTALGIGLGNLFWLTDNVQLNTAVMWQDLRFDRAQGSSGASRATGSQWALRAGLTIGFNDWGR
jgi:hypothetical protein